MITIISPAKKMKSRKREELALTNTLFPEQTERLMALLKTYSPWELESLMKINEKLALQTFEAIQHFSLEEEGTAAILTYDGLVFQHADATHWDDTMLAYAQNHVRIFSGCYGCLRPLDAVLPYRLEMQCKLSVDGQNLYQFWGDRLYQALYDETDVVLNLASEEYAKCVRKYVTHEKFIDVEFLTWQKGVWKTLATPAKMARGHLLQYIVEHQIDRPQDITTFQWNGFVYDASRSNEKRITFLQQ